MSLDIIQERLEREQPTTAAREQHVLREILQEIALSGLAHAGFFKQGAFHGGSSLRILHGLRRFSEDLDFILRQPNAGFAWARFADGLAAELALYGVDLEISDRSDERAVKCAFLKDESLGKLLRLRYPLRPGQKLTIKLEIDTNPPEGSVFEIRYVDFPVPFSVLAQDLSSGFALKLHAQLCRKYVKGRDWFDFLWYLQRQCVPRWDLLSNALAQTGPWQGHVRTIDAAWLVRELRTKVAAIDWTAAKQDVERFLGEPERRGLDVWDEAFFLAKAQALDASLAPR